MGSGIVIGTICFAITAMFAIGEKLFVWRSVNADETFSGGCMCTRNMAVELMCATKSIRAFVAILTHDLWVLRSNVGSFSDDTNIFGRPVLRPYPHHLII